MVSNGYRRPKLIVPWTYRITLLAAFRWDSFGAASISCTSTYTKGNVESRLLSSIADSLWYSYILVGSTSTPLRSLVIFSLVLIGVSTGLDSKSPNLDTRSLANLDWFRNIPSKVYLIYNPRKNHNSPSILISNSDFIVWANPCKNSSHVDPNMMSST